jgi:hypothetical protein
MGADFTGTIIEESLEKPAVLKKLKVTRTEVEKVTAEHRTPWIRQWTIPAVEVPENQASKIAKELSRSLDSKHAWYADFKNDTHHYIIFYGKVFYIDRTSKEQYGRARAYGISLGIPEHQVDFEKEAKKA